MIKGGKKKSGGFVELQDPPTSTTTTTTTTDHDHLAHLEDVSLGGDGGAAWLARPVRRGNSDDDETTPPSSSSVGPSPSDDVDPFRSGAAGAGTAGAAAAASKRWLGGGRWPPSAEQAAAAKGLGWLALALLLASMNPSVLAGLMAQSARVESLLYTPVSILGAASLVGFLVAVRCVDCLLGLRLLLI